MSSKRTGVPVAVAQLVVARDLWSCVCCGAGVMGLERGVSWSIHHRIPRGMGGTRDERINGPANLVVLCGSGTTGCHGEAERNRAAARERGLLVWRSQNPAEVPVQVCVQRASGLDPMVCVPYLLDDEGGRVETAPPPSLEVATAAAATRAARLAKARAKYRRIRDRRLAERVLVDGRWVHPSAPHGSNSTYNSYGCRCLPCTDAHSRANAASRAKARTT